MCNEAGERRPRAAGEHLRFAHFDALCAQARVDLDLHRARRAAVGQLALQVGLDVDAGRARARRADLASELHRGRARIEQRRLQGRERGGQVPALAAPAPTARDAARSLRRGAELGLEAAQFQLGRVVGPAAECECQAPQRQPLVVPAASRGVVQVDVDRGRLIKPAAAGHRPPAQARGRCCAAEGRQVERLRAGLQVTERPGRERPQRGACIERLQRLFRCRLRAHRGQQHRCRDRPVERDAGAPCRQVAERALREAERCVELHRRSAGNAGRATCLQPVPAEAELIDAVFAASAGTEMKAALQLLQRLVAERAQVQRV